MTSDIITNLKQKDSRTISRSISMVENKQDGYLDLLSDIMISLNSLAPEDFKSWLTTQYANMTIICQR